jgi:peptidoglycan/xylan/chitin deacetylase (PgdA/CDA1 family)
VTGAAPRTVVLTFDNLGEAAELERGQWPADRPMGDHPSVTRVLPRLLDLLDELALRATFFVEAVNTREYPDAVGEIARRGHEIGFHAWCHERWGALEPAQERDIIERGRAAYADHGLAVRGFRPPGGGLSDRTVPLLTEAGFDWMSPEGDRAHRDPAGMAVIPFRWPLVDATYLYEPFAGVRARLGLPGPPIDAADADGRLLDELAADRDPLSATLILHPFLAADASVRDAHERLLRRLAAERDAGRMRVVPGAVVADELLR